MDADLPFPMSYASVVGDRHKDKICISPGGSPDATAYNKVLNFYLKRGGWNELASPDDHFRILQMDAILSRRLPIC